MVCAGSGFLRLFPACLKSMSRKPRLRNLAVQAERYMFYHDNDLIKQQ